MGDVYGTDEYTKMASQQKHHYGVSKLHEKFEIMDFHHPKITSD